MGIKVGDRIRIIGNPIVSGDKFGESTRIVFDKIIKRKRSVRVYKIEGYDNDNLLYFSCKFGKCWHYINIEQESENIFWVLVRKTKGAVH